MSVYAVKCVFLDFYWLYPWVVFLPAWLFLFIHANFFISVNSSYILKVILSYIHSLPFPIIVWPMHYPSPWCVFRLSSNMAHWLSFLSKWTVHHLKWVSKPSLRLWTHYTYKSKFFPHSSFQDGLGNRKKWFWGKGCRWLCTRFWTVLHYL